MVPQQMTTFFCAVYTLRFFSTHLCCWFGVGRKIKLIKIILRRNSVPPCKMGTQLYLILTVLLPIFMSVTAILREQVVHSPQKYVEKITAQHMDADLFISMWSASLAESSADTYGKKSQHVALVSPLHTQAQYHTMKHTLIT